MSTCMETWSEAIKQSEFKVILEDKEVKPLAKSIYQTLANRQIVYREFIKFGKKKEELLKIYLGGVRNVLSEGKALAGKLGAHPKALKELNNFLEEINSEGDYELDDVSGGFLNLSTSAAAKTLKWWTGTVVPAIKKHGVAPALAVSSSKMQSLLTKLLDLLKPVQEASKTVMSMNAQTSKWQLSFNSTADKLLGLLNAWKDKTQVPNALKLAKALEDIKRRVGLQEI
jgi:hypothetical protein